MLLLMLYRLTILIILSASFGHRFHSTPSSIASLIHFVTSAHSVCQFSFVGIHIHTSVSRFVALVPTAGGGTTHVSNGSTPAVQAWPTNATVVISQARRGDARARQQNGFVRKLRRFGKGHTERSSSVFDGVHKQAVVSVNAVCRLGRRNRH